MYEKNDMSKFLKNPKFNEVLDNFLTNRNYEKTHNPLLNSTAFSECYKTLRSSSTKDNSVISTSSEFDYKSFKEMKIKPIRDKFIDYTKSFDKNKSIRLNDKENKMNKNLDILNYRYKDVKTNNYILNFLPRFKRIYSYNEKAQKLYKNEVEDKNSNKVNILTKIEEYKKFLKFNNINK
jgi:hypothetical protein